MTYQELTPAEKGILAVTIDRYQGWSDDSLAFAAKEEALASDMTTDEQEAWSIAYDAVKDYYLK
jgi:hypothetical protein